MESDKVRSSTRIRKPTAKMKDNINTNSKLASKQKVDPLDWDVIDSKKIKNATEKHNQQIDSVKKDNGKNRLSFYCKTADTMSVGKESEAEKDGFSLKMNDDNPKKSSICDIYKECSEGNDNSNSILEANTSESANCEVENKTDNQTEDVSETKKKQTVQVCVRLKDMILLPGSGCGETFDERKQEDNCSKNDSYIHNQSEKKKFLGQNEFDKSDALTSDKKMESLEEFCFRKFNQKNINMFKEDGSFVESYELKGRFKGLRSGERNSSKQLVCGEIDRLMKGTDNVLDNFEESSKDVDVQAEIELEHLDMSDEELSDFEEAITEKSLQCNICSKSFSKKYYLTKHMALHTDVKSFQCEVCGMSFATKAYLTLHSVVHSRIRKYKCELCDKAFLRRANLNTHKRTHSDVKAFSCDTCNKKFKTKSGRDLHKKEHGSVQENQCHQCGKSFSQQAYLLKHISIHAGIKPFKCTDCGKSFPYNQSLQEHMRRHTGEKPETCDKCGKSFNNKRLLKAHMKYHNTVTQFSCKLCNLFYDSEQSLNKHITKTHNRRYDCTLCHESFINKKHLRSHQAREHKQLIAESRLIPAGSLAKAKKAVCSLCNSVFFNRYVLSKHLMSIHRLPEQDMKELLNIRKKGTSKNHSSKKMSSDLNVKDVDEKSFRVYYKDEEMAVYVKGTNDFETRLKAMTESNETKKGDDKVDEGVSYIVLEDNGMNDVSNYSDITYSNDDDEESGVKKKAMKEVGQGSDINIVASNRAEQNDQVENADLYDQNYYVVFTEANENSEKMVEEIQSEVIVKEELQNITDDGTERIVLILNEGDDGKNFMLENGEHLQILSDRMEILPADNDKAEENYEVVATVPLNVRDDLNCQKSFLVQDECFTNNSSNCEPIVLGASGSVDGSNVPLLEQFQTHDLVNNTEKVRVLTDEKDNIESKDLFKNVIPSQVISENVTNEEILSLQYQRSNDARTTDLAEENFIFVQSENSVNAQSSMVSEVNKETVFTEMESNGMEKFLPKDNSAQEFTNFENALKSKSGDFESQDEYNKFIDKMIQTLQKAKNSDQH